MIEVDIYEAGKHFMKGRPVADSKPFTPSIAAPLQKGEVSGLMQVNTQIHVHLKTRPIYLTIISISVCKNYKTSSNCQKICEQVFVAVRKKHALEINIANSSSLN